MYNNIVITADSDADLRAWVLKEDNRLIITILFHKSKKGRSANSISLTINETQSRDDRVNISIKYNNDSFTIYTLLRRDRRFIYRYIHALSRNDSIHIITYASSYLLTITEASLLSLYRFN